MAHTVDDKSKKNATARTMMIILAALVLLLVAGLYLNQKAYQELKTEHAQQVEQIDTMAQESLGEACTVLRSGNYQLFSSRCFRYYALADLLGDDGGVAKLLQMIEFDEAVFSSLSREERATLADMLEAILRLPPESRLPEVNEAMEYFASLRSTYTGN